MVAKHVNRKNAGKPRVLAINVLLHSLAGLAAILLWLSIVTFMTQSHCQSEFCTNMMCHKSDPDEAGYPTYLVISQYA